MFVIFIICHLKSESLHQEPHICKRMNTIDLYSNI